ncbi:beta-ketoacyl synthase N-terminal-like domain-containing protein [Methylomusa anaerophila]
MAAGADTAATIDAWITKRDYAKLLERWTDGWNLDWNRLYGDIKPRRISLPTYPFARERYWIPASNNQTDQTNQTNREETAGVSWPRNVQSDNSLNCRQPDRPAYLHPLLHQNTSDLSKQRFSTIFTGQEFFLADHIVKEQRVLPGAAYLEMARTAVAYSAGVRQEKSIQLKNVVWTRPIIVAEPVQVHVELFAEPNGEIVYEIYSRPEKSDSEPVLHSQGRAGLSSVDAGPNLDIESLQSKCNQAIFSAGQCYEAFRAVGIDYGPSHQGVEKIWAGHGQVLAKLSLPAAVADTKEQFILHPSLLDSALQASIGLMPGSGNAIPSGGEARPQPFLPFALQKIEIVGKCTAVMWALLRYSHGSQAGGNVAKIDIDLYDDQGNIKVRLKGLSLRVLAGEREVSSPPAAIPGVQVIEKDLLRQKAINYLKKQFSAVIKLPEQKIAADASLEKYGVDSIMAMELTNQLENIFGPLSKTLLFEYQNIQALAEYFLATYRGKLLEVLGMAATTAASADASQDTGLTPAAVPVSERRERPRFASIQIEVPARKATDAWDIAIIGLAGRYPGGATIQEFWGNLQAGRDCITEIPQERWNHRLFFDENKNTPEKTYCKWGGFLEEVDQFDPLFFNISPREAEIMEPMDRLFLETVWNLLESTGYTREALQRQYEAKVGVYVGAMYQQYHAFDSDMVKEAAISLSSYSSIANRVSHYFNFQGPSIAIDTMCSSSTIAIHMACESLMRRESRIVIAGGVNLSIHPKKYIGLSQRQMIGSHVNSRSFGDGDGYLPAECVGAVLLKPLLEAIQDGDTILAVIKSTATNHGGHTSGITVPNPNAQAKLIEDNFIKSGIDPRTISYVEAAANGSALGDAIEITALNKAFQKFTTDQQFCPIGSVKSNIGHAEAASGITQLTKVILQLQHRRLVPSIKAEPPNPNIDFNNTPFYLQRELQEWQRPLVKINGAEREFPRRATVSSFGAGGSNAHLIIEEYVPPQEEPVPIQNTPAMKPQLIVFSARNPERLQAVIEKMLHFIEVQKDISLPDLAYTLQLGREAMEYRVAMMANSRQELVRGMREYLAAIKAGQELPASVPVFSGNTEEDHSEIRSLLSGIAGETLLQVFLVEKDLNKLALYWVKGGKIPWESLHAGEKVRRISLPTYPFEKRRCWLEPHKPPSPGQQFTFASPAAAEVIPSQEVHKVINENEEPASMPNAAGTQYTGIDNLDNQVANIIANLLGMTAAELNLNKPLDQYGLDSIQFISLFQRLQSQIDLSLTLDKLRETKTAQDIIAVLRPEKGDKPAAPGQQAVVSVLAASEFIPKDWSKFPELIHLNENFKGRPVFWIHGAIGGVETYQGIARKIQRPFYGIQARGWMTDRVPLNGIQATAAYYVNIIRSVQPSGPYDLGGYSLGGAIAYEITRQLQEMGEAVATLVMLDAFDGSGLSKFSFSDRDILLQTVNIALMNTILQEPEKFAQTFIHRDELILTGDDKEELVKQVVKLAQKRGLKKTETQLYAMSQKDLAIRRAYEMGSFSVWPLPDAQTVKCYYFRNRNGLFYGALEPYLSAAETSLNSLTHTNYWKEWEREMPHFYMMDVDASNHMVLLSEPQSYEPIMALCEKLYSETGMTPEFFEPFFQKHKS